MLSQKMKGISSVIGAVLFNLVLGSIYLWSNINTYLVSYLKYHDSPDIQIVDGFFLMPIISFVSNISNCFGTKLTEAVGLKKSLFLSISLIIVSHLLLLFSTKLSVVYSAMTLFGIAGGLGYMGIIKNGWLYFPNSKGLVSGLILFGYGFSSFILTSLSDSIVNPNFEGVDSSGFLDEEVAENMYNFIYILNIILAGLGIVGFLMIFEFYDSTDTEKLKKDNEQSYRILEQKSPAKSHINQILHSMQFWQIVIMNFSTMFFCYTCANTNRAFGQLNGKSERFLSAASKTFSVANATGRIMWGILFDKYGFKPLYFLVILAEILISSTFYYAVHFDFIYFSMIIGGAFLFSGNVTLMVPLYPKIFGMKDATLANGISMSLYGLSSIFGSMIAKFLVKEESDYRLFYLIGTSFAVVSLLTLLIFSDKIFEYEGEGDKEEVVMMKEKIEKASEDMLIKDN